MGTYVIPSQPPVGRTFANYAVTRKQKRAIAKYNMEKAGLTKICKSHRYSKQTPLGKWINMKDPSKFATSWREYVEV